MKRGGSQDWAGLMARLVWLLSRSFFPLGTGALQDKVVRLGKPRRCEEPAGHCMVKVDNLRR